MFFGVDAVKFEALDESFVANYYDIACAYFNPYRTDLPECLQEYGFPFGSILIDFRGTVKKIQWMSKMRKSLEIGEYVDLGHV